MVSRRRWRENVKDHLIGLICGASAGVFYALGNCFVQYIYRKNPYLDLSEFQIIFVRSCVQLLLIVVLLAWKRINPWGGSWPNFGLLWLMGFAKICSIVFFYGSLSGLPLGDATVILFTAPVFTIFLSILFLKESCSLCNIILGLFSFVGVVIIAAPGMFFPSPGKSHQHTQSSHYHSKHALLPKHNITSIHSHSVIIDSNKMKSVGFGLCAAVALAFHMIILKINTKSVDYKVALLYPSLYGVIFSPLFMIAEHHDIVLFHDLDPLYWVLMICSGFFYFIGMMLLAYALLKENAGPVALVRNSEVIFAFVFEILIEGQMPMMFSIVGVVLILWTTSMGLPQGLA
eukprot:TCONS_00004174-protein